MSTVITNSDLIKNTMKPSEHSVFSCISRKSDKRFTIEKLRLSAVTGTAPSFSDFPEKFYVNGSYSRISTFSEKSNQLSGSITTDENLSYRTMDEYHHTSSELIYYASIGKVLDPVSCLTLTLGIPIENTDFPVSSFRFFSESLTERTCGPPLSMYEKQVVMGAFTEVIEQLNIIKNYLPYSKFDWGKAYEDAETYLLKISGRITEHVFPPYHEYEHSPLWKVQLDRYLLQKIIEDTKDEIFSEGTYYTLVEFLNTMEYVKKQEEIVMRENVDFKRLLHDLKKVVVPKITTPSSENQIEDIFASEDEVMLDERIRMGIEERYIDAWEKARTDQNAMKIAKEERDLEEKLVALDNEQKMESRVNNEMTTFILYETADLENMVTEWTNTYNRELEIEDTLLIQLNSEKEIIENKMKNLLVKFHHQTEVIDELQKFFEEYAREQEMHNKRVKAAALIQYWWRKYLAIKREVIAKAKAAKKAERKNK